MQGLSGVATRQVDLHTTSQILKIYIEGLCSTLLSQVCVFRIAPTGGTIGRIYISKDRGENVKPLIAQVLLTGQPVVSPLSYLLQHSLTECWISLPTP